MKIHHPCRNVDRKTAEAGYGPWHNNTMLIFDIPYRSSFPHRSLVPHRTLTALAVNSGPYTEQLSILTLGRQTAAVRNLEILVWGIITNL